MKLKYAGVLTAALMTFSTAANADSLFDVYAGATIGVGGATMYVSGDEVSRSAQSAGAVLGLDIPVFRFELEYDYMQTKATRLHIGMINAYAKMPLPLVKPYLGVGIGNIFYGEIKDIDVDVDSVAAYQGMLGVTFDIPVLPIDVDVEGRVLYAADIYEFAGEKPDYLQYEARLKLRYVF